jgi:hypothetical protein
MAHYAFLDDNNKVTEVITGIDESSTDTLPQGYVSWEAWYLTQRPNATDCKRTSYNTTNNAHTGDGTAFRGNYAGVGFSYDSINDVFIPPKPYESWVLDEDIWDWEAPIDMPDDDNAYVWDEDAYQEDNTTGWVAG